MKIKKKRRSSDNFADEDIVLGKESNDESHMNIVNMVNISSIHGKKKFMIMFVFINFVLIVPAHDCRTSY